MKRSKSQTRKAAHDGCSRCEINGQAKTPEPRPSPSTNVSQPLAEEELTGTEHSPDEAGGSRHTSTKTAWELRSIHRPDEPRRPRYTRHKFTSSGTSTPSTRPDPSDVTEESLVWSGIAKHRSSLPENNGRLPLDAYTKPAITPTSTKGRGRYLEDAHDESQSPILLKPETPGGLSRASEKYGKYKGWHPAPETRRLERGGVDAAIDLDERPRHEDSSQATLLTGPRPLSVPTRSPPNLDESRTRRRPSATLHLSSRPPPDTKDRAAFALPSALRGHRKTNAIKAMGDTVCYAARSSKIQIESTKTSSRSRRRSSSGTRSSQDLTPRGAPLVHTTDKPSSQTPSSVLQSSSSTGDIQKLQSWTPPSVLQSSSSKGEIQKLRSPTPPSAAVDRSTTSITGRLEDRRRVPSTFGDRRQLEVFVDITRRHHATMAEPTLATSSRSGSPPASFVERISAAVRIRPGGATSLKGPPKLSEDSQPADIRKRSIEERHAVDFRRFLPESEDALPYTELLHYPKHRPEEAPKPAVEQLDSDPEADLGRFIFTSKEALAYTQLLDYPKRRPEKASKPPTEETEPGPKVDLERFMPHSKEALAYTDLLQYPKHRPEKPSKPAGKETESEPSVDLERFMPYSKEALAYTELLEYPKRRSKAVPKLVTRPMRWETRGIPAVSPPSKTFSWSVPAKKPSRPISRRTSLAKTVGPAKRETTPPPVTRPVPSKPVGPPPPPAPKGKKIVSLRPFVASFHAADEDGEEASISPGPPSTPAIMVSMKPPPEDSHGTKHHPFVRPFYMTVRGKLDDEQPAQKPPEKPPQEPRKKPEEKPPVKRPAKQVEKPPEKSPGPETVTTPDIHRRLPTGLRPFRGSVHDTGGMTPRAVPLITKKEVPAPMAKTAAGAPAARSFAIDVKGTSGGPGPRRVSATKARVASRGPAKTAPIHIHDSSINITRKPCDTLKVAAPSKPLPPAPPGMRIISMSTGHGNIRETMLWDFSPAPPTKTPQLHSKRASIAPTETPKVGTAAPSKALPKETAPAVTKPAGAKLDQAKGPTAATTPKRSMVAPPGKSQPQPPKPEATIKTAPPPEQAKTGKEPQKTAEEKTAALALPTAKASKEPVAAPVKPATHADASAKKNEKQSAAPQEGKTSKEAATEQVPSVGRASKPTLETASTPAKPAAHAEVITAKAEKPPSASPTRNASKEATTPVKPAAHAIASAAKTEKPTSASSVRKASKEVIKAPANLAAHDKSGATKDEKPPAAQSEAKLSKEVASTPAKPVAHVQEGSSKAEVAPSVVPRAKEAVSTPAKQGARAEATAPVAEKTPSAASTATKEAVKPAVHAVPSSAKAEKVLSVVPAAKPSKEVVTAPVIQGMHAEATMPTAEKTPLTIATPKREALKPAIHVVPSSLKAEKTPSDVHSSMSSASSKPVSKVPAGILKGASSTVVKPQQSAEHSAAIDVKKPSSAISSAKHSQETVSKPATAVPPEHASVVKAAPAEPAPAATTAAASEKSQPGTTTAKPLSEVASAHAKAEPPKPAAVATPVIAPQAKPTPQKLPSQAIIPRRHSIATIAPQAAVQERENAAKNAEKASNAKPSGGERRPSSSQIVIRAVVRTTSQGESKAVIPKPTTTPAKRASTDAETGVKLEVKPEPQTRPPGPAEPPVACRPYKACVQMNEPEEPPEQPKEEETMHPLRVPDSKSLVPVIEQKSPVVPVEQPPAPPEETKPPPPPKKEEPPKTPPEEVKPPPPAKKEEPPKPPPDVPKQEPVSHPIRNFRAMVKSVGTRKAQGRHKCAKHKDETSSQYERRKRRVMSKRKEKAKAKVDALKKVEEKSPEMKPLRQKPKKKHKCRCARKAAKEGSESTTKEDDQTSDAKPARKKSKRKWKKPSKTTASNRLARKKGVQLPFKHRTPPEHYAQRKTSPLILCCVCLTALIIVGLLAAFIWHEKEAVTTTTSSTSSSTPVTFLPPYSKIYYCSSDVCKAEAGYIRSLLSANKNPCDNFYEYVCDGWNKIHPVPATGAGGVQSVDTMLQDKLLLSLEPLLLGVPDTDVRVAAGLYENCLRRDQVGQDGDTVVGVARQFFRDWVIKEWPVLTPDAITTSVVWTFAGELVRDLNVAALTSVSIGVSPKALETASIELDNPRLLFSCNDASRPAVTDLFSAALTELMTRFSAASNKKNVEDVMRVFIRVGSSPAIAARPDSGPLSYTLIKLIDLDHGYTQFLERVFGGIIAIDGTTEVVLKSTDYVRNYLTEAMQELPAHAVANYLGFVALAKMAPFFPEKFASFRQIFAKDVLDRTLPDVSQTKTLCLLAVQQLLPGCFAKAATQLRGMWGAVLPLSDWLARLQSSFGHHHDLVAWIDELSALVVRYRLKRNRMAALSTGYSEPCAPAPNEIPRRSEHPLRFFHQVSMLQEQKRLQAILRSGRDVLAQSGEPRSELATVPDYEVMRQLVHVSMALFNTSVPSNATVFAFHLSRVAVRLYRALVQLLFPNIYERDAPITLGDDARRQLDRLLSCFEDDLRRLPASVRGPVSIDSAKSRGALLQHVAAIKLALRAFDDNLNVRRIWRVDYRFQDLPNVSSDALFFIYYALDNCESADTVYAEHRGHWLPAHYRVNAALRHVDEFAHEFGCAPATDMASGTSMCNVLKRH